MTERDLDEISKELDNLVIDLADREWKESQLQEQISKLRSQLFELQQKKKEVKIKRTNLQREKESAERKAELAKEQERIEEDLSALREQAERLIANAPWRSKIFNWQIDGAVKLSAAKRGILADVRGLGKTLSSIAWRRLTESKKTLVLTRRQYANEFMREVNFWEPGISVVPIIGATPMHRKTLLGVVKNHEDFIVVANFEMWRRDKEGVVADLLTVPFDSIILDEAHQLKEITSVTTQGYLKLAAEVPNIIEMTGTPVQNRPQELFALLHPLYPRMFPTKGKFVNDYCWQIGQNKWGWAPGGLDALMNKMSGFFVARTPDDVGHKVPPPAIYEYELDFEGYPEQKEAYQLMALRALAKLEERVLSIPNQLTLMLRQSQLIAWPAGIVFEDEDTKEKFRWNIHQSVKADWAEDLIKELTDEGHRVVLFSRFKAPIFELQNRLQGDISVAVITGESGDTRHIIDDFDLKTAPENPRYQVLLATYDTVSEAVNLNAARHAIQYDRYWKPSRDDQAIGRIDRLNSIDQATIHRAHVVNSMDTHMIKLIEEKKDMLNDFKSAKDMQEDLKNNLRESLR